MSELSVGDAVPVRRVADRGSVAIYRVILRCRGAVCRLWCRLGRYVAMVGWGYLCIAQLACGGQLDADTEVRQFHAFQLKN